MTFFFVYISGKPSRAVSIDELLDAYAERVNSTGIYTFKMIMKRDPTDVFMSHGLNDKDVQLTFKSIVAAKK